MRNFIQTALVLTLTMLFLSACSTGGGGGGESSQMNYKDMKSMVIDILKTEDAQKALQESATAQSGYSAKSTSALSVQDQEKVRIAVKDVMSSPDYDQVLKSLMTDTRFAGEFSKSVNKMNKELHQELIKDPQYQAGLVSAFEGEEMQKVILKVVKGTEYRKELMSLMQDSLQNPIFRLEILELMKKAVTEELSVKQKSGESGGTSESSSSGKDSGSESESEGDSENQGQSKSKS